MLEKVNELAERAATNVSRRQFLGRFGRATLMSAGALAAFLALPRTATAGRRCPRGYHWCKPAYDCIPVGTPCHRDRF